MVQHICQNDTFAMLLNATDYEGNTPLHLAVKYGFPRIVGVLLQIMAVEIGITNRDGLSVQDLADRAVSPSRWCYFLVSLSCLIIRICMHHSPIFSELPKIKFSCIISVEPPSDVGLRMLLEFVSFISF